jgi:hypothetical protein
MLTMVAGWGAMQASHINKNKTSQLQSWFYLQRECQWTQLKTWPGQWTQPNTYNKLMISVASYEPIKSIQPTTAVTCADLAMNHPTSSINMCHEHSPCCCSLQVCTTLVLVEQNFHRSDTKEAWHVLLIQFYHKKSIVASLSFIRPQNWIKK